MASRVAYLRAVTDAEASGPETGRGGCRRRAVRWAGRVEADTLERVAESLAARAILLIIRVLILVFRYGGWVAGGFAAWRGVLTGPGGSVVGGGVGSRLLLNTTHGEH